MDRLDVPRRPGPVAGRAALDAARRGVRLRVGEDVGARRGRRCTPRWSAAVNVWELDHAVLAVARRDGRGVVAGEHLAQARQHAGAERQDVRRARVAGRARREVAGVAVGPEVDRASRRGCSAWAAG